MELTVRIILLSSVSLISFGEAKSAKKIIGGTEAPITDFPSFVSIRRSDEHDCGGSIIDKYHVLTAAHCVIDRNGDLKIDLKVWSGLPNYKIHPSDDQIHQPDVISLHDDYTIADRRLHDIAIIKLLEPIVFSTLQQPVFLPTSDVPIGTTVTAIGAGWINSETEEKPKVLQKLEMSVISNEKCQEMWTFNNLTISPGDICTSSNKTHGACSGDSGSPLMYRGSIIGVISYTTTNCDNSYPDISVRVWQYIPWIEDVLTGKPTLKIYYPRLFYTF